MAIARHAIVTGGSSGIGKETAKLLARRGASVTLMARRKDVLADARREVEAARASPTQRVLDVSVDVADREAITAAINNACDRLGTCDLLVASAGIAIPGHFHDLDFEIFERTMAVNYFGVLYAIRAVAPAMKAERRGRVVLVSSGAGIVGLFGYSAYAPSKFALRGLAETLRNEFAGDGVGVSIVYPPDTDTPQLAAEMPHKPAETRAITAGARTWSAEGVAACIVRGIEKGRFAITPGWEMTWLYRLHSVAMPIFAWHFDRIVARTRASSGG